MARGLSDEESRIGELGAQLAQAHYALTTDHEGPLPMKPTDADRQKLVTLLDRAPTIEEEQLFESGYREAHGRLAGNANLGETGKGFDPVLHAELFSLISKYGAVIPPEGTPERVEAQLLATKAVNSLKDDLGKLIRELPPPEREEAPEPALYAGVPVSDNRR
jgi:hypothetical protein